MIDIFVSSRSFLLAFRTRTLDNDNVFASLIPMSSNTTLMAGNYYRDTLGKPGTCQLVWKQRDNPTGGVYPGKVMPGCNGENKNDGSDSSSIDLERVIRHVVRWLDAQQQ